MKCWLLAFFALQLTSTVSSATEQQPIDLDLKCRDSFGSPIRLVSDGNGSAVQIGTAIHPGAQFQLRQGPTGGRAIEVERSTKTGERSYAISLTSQRLDSLKPGDEADLRFSGRLNLYLKGAVVDSQPLDCQGRLALPRLLPRQ
jgi:hypothetical protein